LGSPLNPYNLGLFNSGIYTPGIQYIESITNAQNALVTTTADHSYVVGQSVQFFIPPQWGIRQLNQRKGVVLTVPTDTTFTVNINTTTFDAFITPSPAPYIVIDTPQVAAVGDFNNGKLAVNGVLQQPNTVPGAFINTPPN
jgi:hypothetical protein